MSSVSTILSALVAGAAEAAKPVATQAVMDGYAGLKDLIQRKYGTQTDLLEALAKVESRPDSAARQSALMEELQLAKIDNDSEVAAAARQFLDLLAQQGPAGYQSAKVNLSGSGAIAQGVGSVAAGQGGVAIGGNVSGSVITTGSQIRGDYVSGDKVLGDKIERQINTGGGAYVGGGVKVSGGDFIGRDQINYDPRSGKDNELSAEDKKLAALLREYFSKEELRDICEQLGQDWTRISAGNLEDTTRTLVTGIELDGKLQQLKLLMRVARPQLRGQLT